MTDPLISVVIPCYNGSAYLQACVRSILDQQFDCEIIVVDDGSTDDSLAVAKSLMAECPRRMITVCQQNQGPAVARNTGLQAARGKYVCFPDVDDEYVPGFFAHAVGVFEGNPAIAVVVAGIELMDAHRSVEQFQMDILERSIPGNVLVLTRAARQVCGFPVHPAYRGELAGEDCVFRKQLYTQGEIIKIVSPSYYKYRVRRGSHFDFLLDRVSLKDGHTHFSKFSKEEEDGTLTEAARLHQDKITKHALADIVEKLRLSLTAGFEFHNLDTNLKAIEGFLHPLEGFALYQLAKSWPVAGGTVEIGSFKGLSTCWLAAGCKEGRKGKVSAVDHFHGSKEHQPQGSHADADIVAVGSTLPAFRRNIEAMGLNDWVNVHAGASTDIARSWREPIRLLFIDGDHSYEASVLDYQSWSHLVVPHGLVVFHDITVWQGVTRLYTELCSDRQNWQELVRVRSLGILEKLAPG